MEGYAARRWRCTWPAKTVDSGSRLWEPTAWVSSGPPCLSSAAVLQARGPEHVEADHRPAEGPEVVVELVHEPAIAPATIGGGARPVASAALGPAAVENDLNRGNAWKRALGILVE